MATVNIRNLSFSVSPFCDLGRRVLVRQLILLLAFGLAGCAPEDLIGNSSGKAQPGFQSVHAVSQPSRANIESNLSGEFIVSGRPIEVRVPVDWLQDPYGDRSWRFWFHSLTFLEPLLANYVATGEPESFIKAAEITLDWVVSNNLGTEGISEFAWYDMAVAARAAILGYLASEAERSGLLSASESSTLMEASEIHGDWLAEEENYKHGHNHGLYEDAGLFILSRQLPSHPSARKWADISARRFVETVKETVQWDEAIHLEHSPSYHFSVSNLLGRLNSQLGMGGEDVADLVERMRIQAPWLVDSDGGYPQLGDTNLVTPTSSREGTESPAVGLNFLPKSGAAIYKTATSYLMFASWYHSSAHKHSDELNFVWSESGRRILVDAGRYGYYYKEPGRIYAESAPAHNTLTIGEPFSRRDGRAYGSAMLDSAQHGDWIALLAHNPMVAPSSHRRLLLYRPGLALLVLDLLSNVPSGNAITRYFHFAPDFEVEIGPEGSVVAKDEEGKVWLVQAGNPMGLRLIRGQKEPIVQGYTFPANRTWVPNTAVEISGANPESGALLTGFVLGNGPNPPSLVLSRIDGEKYRIDIEGIFSIFALEIELDDRVIRSLRSVESRPSASLN